ncbi:MAG: glycosyltransferase [Clostridia bacterium]|nr:glycosyltransferase [Clostridia bacterium]
MYKLSIVIPVYGVEKYLPTCLDSVYSQATDECQIILVDDESPDRCGEMCEEYKARYPEHTTVIHQKNLGLGGARNTGMAAAQGEYLFFIDSDDYITEGTIDHLLSAIEKHSADIFVFPFRLVDEAGRYLGSYKDPFPTLTPLNAKENKSILTGIPSAWNKVCKRALYESLEMTFPSRVWYEDIRTTPKLISKAESVVYLDYEMYNYLQREGSIMSNARVERNIEIVEALEDLYAWFEKEGTLESFRNELEFLTIDHVFLSATVRVIRTAGCSHPLIKTFRSFTEEHCHSFKGGNNPYLRSGMPRSRRLIYNLLKNRLNFAVSLIYKIKK